MVKAGWGWEKRGRGCDKEAGLGSKTYTCVYATCMCTRAVTRAIMKRRYFSSDSDNDDFISPKQKKFDSGNDVKMIDEACITDESESRPIKSNANRALLVHEVMQFLKNANTEYKNYLSTAPAVQPQGGMLFLFDLGPDKEKWELMKRKLRYACIH